MSEPREKVTALGALLDAIEHFIRRYVHMTDDQAGAVALWVAHTYTLDAAFCTPYLSITSAGKESGKTRLLEVLRHLVLRAWFTGRVSAAALARKIDAETPTLLLDESDAAFNGDREYSEVLRGILNAGYSRGGVVTVCVGQGSKISYKDFSAFGPKAIAGIGRLPDTVASRSIDIRLKRRLPSEPVERFRERDMAERTKELRASLDLWAYGLVIDELRVARPELPAQLGDRACDSWELLFAIADGAGKEWSDRARRIALALSGKADSEDEALGIRLLTDCRTAFDGEDKLSTADLLSRLRGLEESPWADFYGKPLSANKLARLLHPYEVKSRDIRFESGVCKGYAREPFEDAWNRWVPPSNRNTRDIGSTEPKTGDFKAQQTDPCCASESAQKPHGKADVAAVALWDADMGERGMGSTTDAEGRAA